MIMEAMVERSTKNTESSLREELASDAHTRPTQVGSQSCSFLRLSESVDSTQDSYNPASSAIALSKTSSAERNTFSGEFNDDMR